jgi:hypothetical protein
MANVGGLQLGSTRLHPAPPARERALFEMKWSAISHVNGRICGAEVAPSHPCSAAMTRVKPRKFITGRGAVPNVFPEPASDPGVRSSWRGAAKGKKGQ